MFESGVFALLQFSMFIVLSALLVNLFEQDDSFLCYFLNHNAEIFFNFSFISQFKFVELIMFAYSQP